MTTTPDGDGQRPTTSSPACPIPPGASSAASSRQNYLAMVGARTNAALVTPAPFVERMVHFWANHFAVSADKLTVIGLAGLLEFEAIRPHVLGRFRDMLVAVEQHPAMLLYLDQAQSIGPDSQRGQLAARFGRQRRGLNENLAREILELHTLGVNSGYTQADVTEFARALTGWTVDGLARGPMRRLIGGDRARPATSISPSASTSPARARSSAAATARRARRRAWPCSTTSPPTRAPRAISPPSSPAISPATSRRRRWSSG